MGKPLTLPRKSSVCTFKKKALRKVAGSFLLTLVLLTQTGCGGNGSEISEEVLRIPVEINWQRFDQDFDRMATSALPELKAKYPYLFPEQYPDSVWLAKHADSLQRVLRSEVQKAFPDLGPQESALELFFKHVRYYFPDYPIPDVVTLTTDVDYENRVILTDSLLLIGLDNYLGPEHEFYGNIERYIASGLDPDLIVSDVAAAFGGRVVPAPNARSFVSQMVFYGKQLYLKDRLMPAAPDSVKIGYSAGHMEWARENEGQIWRYFIERELLYDTDRGLAARFLDPAPFSKFRLVLDNESPGRIGRFMGWQIVRSYMENHPETEMQQMLQLPGETLFRESNYKPPK